MKKPQSKDLQDIFNDFFGEYNGRYVVIYEIPGEKTYLLSNVSDIEAETVLENIVRAFKEGDFTR